MAIYKHDLNKCPFTKTNLVTQSGVTGNYDSYKCSQCGVIGRRYGLDPYLTLNQQPKCPPTELPKQVRIKANQIGLDEGAVMDVVPSPERKFAASVWVFSVKRNEPVLLHPREYEAVPVDLPQSDAQNPH